MSAGRLYIFASLGGGNSNIIKLFRCLYIKYIFPPTIYGAKAILYARMGGKVVGVDAAVATNKITMSERITLLP